MRAMPHETPELVDRTEIADFAKRWPPEAGSAAWPHEAFSPWWHNESIPAVGARVLLCFRVPHAAGWQIGWVWAEVCEVRRFRLLVQLLQPVPRTRLMVGQKLSIDPQDHPHATLDGAASVAAHSAWLSKFWTHGPQPYQGKGESHVLS
jgi:hypothetical protein